MSSSNPIPEDGKTYVFTSVSGDIAMDCNAWNKYMAVGFQKHGGIPQQWTLTKTASGNWKIKSEFSQGFLSPPADYQAGSQLYTLNTNFEWKIAPDSTDNTTWRMTPNDSTASSLNATFNPSVTTPDDHKLPCITLESQGGDPDTQKRQTWTLEYV